MYKKLFGSILLVFSLVFFVSCEQDGKKDTKEKSSYKRGGRRDNRFPRGDRNNCPSETCPSSKKTCPSSCQKKCCLNEKSEKEISKSENSLQEKQEIISTQDLTSKNLPLEDLKAAIESDSLNFIEE